jgi:aryl-alcohol dehydrogenase-like predicted oxidoreductase
MLTILHFDKSGHKSTRIVFGGAALEKATQQEADHVLQVLLEHGVNHIDTAAYYGDGTAELRIGPWMRVYRSSFFLATKTRKRTYREAWQDLLNSLKRLQVDYVDLMQLHNLVDPQEWEIAMGKNGALEAIVEALRTGLVRSLGVTGHGYTAPAMHMRSLKRFEFNSVMLPLNYIMMQNPHYRMSFEELEDYCMKKDIAIQTINSIARGPWGNKSVTSSCWYEPLTDEEDISKAIHWVLNHGSVFLVSAADINLLPKILKAASIPSLGPTDQDMKDFVSNREMTSIFT